MHIDGLHIQYYIPTVLPSCSSASKANTSDLHSYSPIYQDSLAVQYYIPAIHIPTTNTTNLHLHSPTCRSDILTAATVLYPYSPSQSHQYSYHPAPMLNPYTPYETPIILLPHINTERIHSTPTLLQSYSYISIFNTYTSHHNFYHPTPTCHRSICICRSHTNIPTFLLPHIST